MIKHLSTIFTLTLLSATVILSYAQSPETEDFSANRLLERVHEKVKDIHTATYKLTVRKYQEPTDSFYYSIDHFKYIECENPADTCGNAKKVIFNSVTGEFREAYDGEKSYYHRDGHIETSTPSAFLNCPKFKEPPFFNYVSSLVDYLLKPNPRVKITVEDNDKDWTIEADVREFGMISFFGKPYQMASLPYAKTIFRLRIPKDNYLPDQIDYYIGWPQQRWVMECSDAEINPFNPDGFSIPDYLPDTEILDANSIQKKSISIKDHFKKITNCQAPTDTLVASDGTNVSLNEYRGKTVLVMLSLANCGPCKASYPVLNKFATEYSNDGLEIIGVLYESTGETGAIASFKKKHKIDFCLTRDNGRFHSYFSLGISPTFALIDRNGILTAITTGFDMIYPEKSEQQLRKIIEASLSTDTDKSLRD